jgi:lysozyme family protein
VLYVLEGYNGFGYRSKGIRSPYLWSFSNLYEKGKYVADHQFDPNAVSKQVGSAVLLKLLSEGGLWP